MDPTESLDFDGDGLGNNADPDDDNDGMSDTFENLYGFNPLDASDATIDTDQDGVNNVDEEVNGTNPLIDDYAPVISTPEIANIDANHTFTKLSLAELVAITRVTVSDGKDGANCCSLVPLGFETGVNNLPSGVYDVTWRAVDEAGNISKVEQLLNVHPLVNFHGGQIVAEGASARVSVVLSGQAPSYPLVIPVEITGSVDGLDYTTTSNEIIITEGTSGFMDIAIAQDFQTEGDEQLIVAFKSTVNAGVNASHNITVTEDNVIAHVTSTLRQNNTLVAAIAKDEGEAQVDLIINDKNIADEHVVDWNIPDEINAQVVGNSLSVIIAPENVQLADDAHGIITLSFTVTDNGTPALAQTQFIHIPLIDQRPRIGSSDTDRDGIADNVEGYADDDNDGLPAFMDSSNIGYLQQLHVNSAQVKLMETEPGLTISIGKYARQQYSDGVQMSQVDIDGTGLIAADTYDRRSDYFDFIINGVSPFGDSIYLVLPLDKALPEFALYRKYSATNGWQNFVENANNAIASAALDNGVCPPLASVAYTAGLTPGYECVRLLIEDGGLNDADGTANGSIDDPGGIAVVPNAEIAKETDPEQSSSGSIFWLLLTLIFLRKNVTSRRD